jgi:hypothetical protein
MSEDFRLGCMDCKKAVWIGQRDHIYTDPDTLKALQKFLFSHQGEEHTLRFGGEYITGYELSDFEFEH